MKGKKGITIRKALDFILLISLGLGLGFALGWVLEIAMDGHFSLLAVLFVLLELFLAYFLNVILHECGHLLMGLATGYGFLSFRILSLLIVRNREGRIEFRRFSIPGTLGQCLLTPPPLDENGRMPCILYNLGGIIVNFMIFIVSALIFMFAPVTGMARTFFAMFGLTGLLMGLENGIPMGSLGINNDGANIAALRKNPRTVLSLWKQLTVNAYQTQGYMLSEMPEELFKMPSEKELRNDLISAEAVLLENLLMERKEIVNALELLDHLLDSGEVKLMSIYRTTLESDRLLLRLLDGRKVDLPRKFRKTLAQFSVFPNVMVARYAVAVLIDRDKKKSCALRKQFTRMIERYPFRSEQVTWPCYLEMVDSKSEMHE